MVTRSPSGPSYLSRVLQGVEEEPTEGGRYPRTLHVGVGGSRALNEWTHSKTEQHFTLDHSPGRALSTSKSLLRRKCRVRQPT